MHEKEYMNITIVGHVDHGKSTVIGRLLADTNSLPEGKLDAVKNQCLKNSKPFEYAFLIDALKDEQAQGITIDAARVFFKTEKRNYIIIDAPGHIEFLKNMVTGASRAKAALLVIDANEGIKENSKRHGYLLSMLGIKQIAVVVNKMDLVDYSREVFENIKKEYTAFLEKLDIKPKIFIPVSGMNGDNIASLSSSTEWYQDSTVLQTLDEFKMEKEPENQPFRMPVQDIYKFTAFGDDRRIIAGTVSSGAAEIGDQLLFYPSGKRSRVKSIESFNTAEKTCIRANEAVGFTLEEQIYISRGEIAFKDGEQKPQVSSRISVNLFWLGKNSMQVGKEYFLKIGSSKTAVKLEKIDFILDASNLNVSHTKKQIERHDVSECVLQLKKDIAFDLSHILSKTSRFVIIDQYEIAGGGIIRKSLQDKKEKIRDIIFMRNYKWERGHISSESRAERYNQKPALIILSGESNSGKKEIAKKLEEILLNHGKIAYYLGISNLVYGVDADIKDLQNKREEHIRRLSEVAHILLDAGNILIVTATELTQKDTEIFTTSIGEDATVELVWIGSKITTDIIPDYQLDNHGQPDELAGILKEVLQQKNIIFKPW